MMRMLLTAIILFSVCTFGIASLSACAQGRTGAIGRKAAPPAKVPADWKNIQVEDFSFAIPPDLKPENLRGIDSTVYGYIGNHMQILIDLGRYSNNLQLYRKQPSYQEEWVTIDSRKAKVGTFYMSDEFANPADDGRRFIAAVFFPDIGIDDLQLSFWVNCESKREQDIAKQVFYSIKFNKGQ